MAIMILSKKEILVHDGPLATLVHVRICLENIIIRWEEGVWNKAKARVGK
jgi:hypothetical protein